MNLLITEASCQFSFGVHKKHLSLMLIVLLAGLIIFFIFLHGKQPIICNNVTRVMFSRPEFRPHNAFYM